MLTWTINCAPWVTKNLPVKVAKKKLEDFYSSGALGFILQTTAQTCSKSSENRTLSHPMQISKPNAPWAHRVW